jgi:hypothetical protein
MRVSLPVPHFAPKNPLSLCSAHAQKGSQKRCACLEDSKHYHEGKPPAFGMPDACPPWHTSDLYLPVRLPPSSIPAHQYLKHRTCNLRADSPPRAGTGPTPTVIAQIDRDAGAAGKISCAFNISITQLPSRNLAASRITVLHVHRSASVMPSGPRFKNTASPAASTLEGLTHNGMQLAEFVQPHTTENSWI